MTMSELRDLIVAKVVDEDRDAICHTTEPYRCGITPQEAAELALETVCLEGYVLVEKAEYDRLVALEDR